MSAKKEIAVVYIITKLELGGAQKICLTLFNECSSNETTTNEFATSTTTYLISGTEGPLVEQVKNNPRALLLPELTREVRFSLGALAQEIRAFFSLVRILKKLKTQHTTVQVHTHSTKAGYMGRWAAWVAGIKTRIHTIHGFGFNDYQPSFIHTIAYVLEYVTAYITTSYICVSTYDQKLGIKKLPGFAKKQCLIRAAVDDQHFIAARKMKNSATTIMTFGSIACFKPQKNSIDLLKAFAQVHENNPNTHLEIIGDGILRPSLEQWIREHNLESAVTLHGWQNDVARFMTTWNCFVLSSLWEGLPCSIVEALFMEIPVFAYNVGGISDIVPDSNLIEPGNWPMLAYKMEQFLQKPTAPSFNHDHEFRMSTMVTQHKKLYLMRQ